MSTVWVIGGTQESRELAQWWVTWPGREWGRLLVTVATASAIARYPHHERLIVLAGRRNNAALASLVQDWQIRAIVDLSHPFAQEISRTAIALAQTHALPYLRYERPAAATTEGLTWHDRQGRPGLVLVNDWPDILHAQYLNRTERTLFTVGTRWLADLAPWQDHSPLFVRVLPRPQALQAAQSAGFSPDHIAALAPPVPAALEAALWEHWQLSQVVTKASGHPGGEEIKRTIAARLGIRLLVVARPTIAYPAQTPHLSGIQTFIATHLGYQAGQS